MADTVGFIGLGTMGFPMVANLAKAGVPLAVFDANPAVMQRAAGLAGVKSMASPREVAAQAAVLFTCLPNNDIVLNAYLKDGIAAGAKPGLITCDCSTVSPEVTREVNQALQQRGVIHMDTPMLGSQPQAVEGNIFFIVAGDPKGLPRIEPYLKIMGRLHMYVGPSSMGNVIKLVHNGLAAVTSVAVAEALALAVKGGADPATFYEVVCKGGGMAFGTYFERRAKRILDGEFSPTFMLELMRKDATLDLNLARQLGVPTPLLEETQRTYEEGVQNGWGKEDFSAVTHVIEKRIGRKLSGK